MQNANSLLMADCSIAVSRYQFVVREEIYWFKIFPSPVTKLHCKKQNVNYNLCSTCLHVEKEDEKQGEDEYGYVACSWLVCGHVGRADVRLVAALIVRTRRRKRRIRLADEEKTRRLIFYIL